MKKKNKNRTRGLWAVILSAVMALVWIVCVVLDIRRGTILTRDGLLHLALAVIWTGATFLWYKMHLNLVEKAKQEEAEEYEDEE